VERLRFRRAPCWQQRCGSALGVALAAQLAASVVLLIALMLFWDWRCLVYGGMARRAVAGVGSSAAYGVPRCNPAPPSKQALLRYADVEPVP